MQRRKLNIDELKNLAVEEGVIKVLVLDGKTNNSMIVECPEHGDVITHIHNGRFDKLNVIDEYKIGK